MSEIVWPNSVQCPVVLSFDVDAELLWKVWLNTEPTLIASSQGLYGPQVGLPRILSMLQRQHINATFFVPGWVAMQHAELIRRVADEGHEIAHHGFCFLGVIITKAQDTGQRVEQEMRFDLCL